MSARTPPGIFSRIDSNERGTKDIPAAISRPRGMTNAPLLICGNCISEAKRHLADGSIDLLICDPPFGIGEGRFGAQYNRDDSCVLPGYVEAPSDYGEWTIRWMEQAKRVLAPNGAMYVVSGHTNLIHVLNAADQLQFDLRNHIIWRYAFGVFTKRKYVTSHYHILYLSRSARSRPTFNTHCRFNPDQRDPNGRSQLYGDLEDVWNIKRDSQRGTSKNANKLPEALVEKMIRYSSNPDDVVGDFFLGNFTTATVAQRLGRNVVGFEMNRAAFDYHLPRIIAA